MRSRQGAWSWALRGRTWVILGATVAFGAMALAGCGRDDEDAPAPKAPTRSAEKNEPPQPKPSPYGPDGKLRPSDQVIAGLRLPMGLEHVYDQERKHSYRASVPTDKLVEYFGPKLLTGQVDRVGQGAVYRHAIPKGVQGGVVKLDVSILPAASGTRVEIVEIRPPPKTPPSLNEIRRELANQRRFNE